MATYVFKLPDIGEGIAESEIAQWHVAVGDRVAEDQLLVDMLTDKAAVEIPSPVSGKIVRLHGVAGDKIAVGAELAILEVEGEGVEASAASAPQVPKIEPPANRRIPVRASPTVRKRARELGIDLTCVRGTGPSGRILHPDLDARVASSAKAPLAAPVDGEIETIKVIGLRRRIAEAMQRAKQRIPHFAYIEEVDVTELEALRTHLNAKHPDRPRLTLLPLLIEAVARAILSWPMVNAIFDDEAGVVTRHRALHVGLATQTPNGLVVPVMRDAQRQDLWERAAGIKRLAEAARAGKSTREELSGSTITITSLGALGGIATTPVINAPEVAIVGVNKMIERPIVRNGQAVVRTMMNLSSSFDHRVIDGWEAASFIQAVKSFLEHPAAMFIERC